MSTRTTTQHSKIVSLIQCKTRVGINKANNRNNITSPANSKLSNGCKSYLKVVFLSVSLSTSISLSVPLFVSLPLLLSLSISLYPSLSFCFFCVSVSESVCFSLPALCCVIFSLFLPYLYLSFPCAHCVFSKIHQWNTFHQPFDRPSSPPTPHGVIAIRLRRLMLINSLEISLLNYFMVSLASYCIAIIIITIKHLPSQSHRSLCVCVWHFCCAFHIGCECIDLKIFSQSKFEASHCFYHHLHYTQTLQIQKSIVEFPSAWHKYLDLDVAFFVWMINIVNIGTHRYRAKWNGIYTGNIRRATMTTRYAQVRNESFFFKFISLTPCLDPLLAYPLGI